MSNRYTRAMNTANAVRVSRDAASPGKEVPVEPSAPPAAAPGTTTHQCLLPRHDPYVWAGDIRCCDCGQEWIATGRRWDGHAYLIRWAVL